MPIIKSKTADGKAVWDGFEGLCDSTSLSQKGLLMLENFRLRSDGSLEKRCGWKTAFRFSDDLRGFWQGDLGGAVLTFAVSGKTVYRLMSDGSFASVGDLSDTAGVVHFVRYRQHLYLLDGSTIWVYRPETDSVTAATGYAPLLGYCWHPTQWGETHEPRNQLSNRVRIHYSNTVGSTSFLLPFFAASVDCVWANGQKIDSYTFTAPSDTVTLPAVYDTVEIAFTLYGESDVQTNLHSATRAFCDRLGEREILLLYGTNAGNYVYGTAEVSDSMLSGSRALYVDSDPLYCPAAMQVPVGDALHPVNAIYVNHDRLLAFTALGATSLQAVGDRLESYPILHGVGCTAPGLELYLDGDPILINEGGILQLSSPASEPDAFRLTCLSGELSALREESLIANAQAFYDADHRELWFCDTVNDRKVWVYQILQKQWITISGFTPTFFLCFDGSSGFAQGNTLCLFDETLTNDDGLFITAVFQTGKLMLVSPERPLRSLQAELLADAGSEGLYFDIVRNDRARTYLLTETNGGNFPTLYQRRLGRGRYRFVQISLRDRSLTRSRIYRMALYGNY